MESMIRRNNRRHLMLFNDCLLVCSHKKPSSPMRMLANNDTLLVHNVMSVGDMAITDLPDEDGLSFQVHANIAHPAALSSTREWHTTGAGTTQILDFPSGLPERQDAMGHRTESVCKGYARRYHGNYYAGVASRSAARDAALCSFAWKHGVASFARAESWRTIRGFPVSLCRRDK
jgi:hypothetical protein